MENRKNNAIAPSIRVKDIQKSLDFYTNSLGLNASSKLTRKDGKLAHATLGFDSPLLMLAPIDNVRTQQTKDDLSRNKHGVGVEFHFGMNGSKKLDEFFAEVKGKGVTVINEPKTEFWGDRTFTVKDPDGYAITFTEYHHDVTPEAWMTAYEAAHKQ